MARWSVLCWVGLLFVGGCVAPEVGDEVNDEPAMEAEGVSPNGVSPNGTTLNGVSPNGTTLSGASIDKIQLNTAAIGGATLTGVSITATVFSGLKTGQVVNGAAFVGATFTATLTDKTTLPVRIDSRAQLTGSNTDIWAYAVSYQTKTGWNRLCGSEADSTAVLAVPLQGTWKAMGDYAAGPGQLTFGCRHTAIAKCVELGYKPWKSVLGTLLDTRLVACTRMLRADYCGDGVSWTIDGTQIDVYDPLGVQTDTQPAWKFEAEWNASGARCVNLAKATRVPHPNGLPACFSKLATATCGDASHWVSGTLMMDRFQP